MYDQATIDYVRRFVPILVTWVEKEYKNFSSGEATYCEESSGMIRGYRRLDGSEKNILLAAGSMPSQYLIDIMTDAAEQLNSKGFDVQIS